MLNSTPGLWKERNAAERGDINREIKKPNTPTKLMDTHIIATNSKKNREWNDRELLKDWRKEWAEQTN